MQLLVISKDEAQKIINERSGTGVIRARRDGTAMDIEVIKCNTVIGQYYSRGEYIDTQFVAIRHGKRGSHLVPMNGKKYD